MNYKNCFYLFLAGSLVLISCSGSDKQDDPEPPEPTRSYLIVNPLKKEVRNPAGTFEVVVSSNTDWTASCPSDWVAISQTSGKGDGVIRVDYGENPTVATREATLRFTAENVDPVQITLTQSDQTFTNPIGGVPDPWITYIDGWYYLCKAHGDALNISRSKKLSYLEGTTTVWSAPKDNGSSKPWNTSHVWAPELYKFGDRWYIYYAAGRPSSEAGGYKLQRSGVVRSKTSDPFGEWEDMGMLYTGDAYTPGIQPTAENTNYAIDLAVFELGGQLYAVWSGAPGTVDSSQDIYIATMSDPCTINSNRVKISIADQPWELVSSKINEGPAILIRGDKLFVVYSCNGSWTKHYRLGWVVMDGLSKDPMVASNWTKSSSAVFFRNDDTADRDGVNGVGHCCFTVSPDGTEDWIVYHVKNRNDSSYTTGRSTFIQKYGWNADGTPDFGTPAGWGQELIIPSGE